MGDLRLIPATPCHKSPLLRSELPLKRINLAVCKNPIRRLSPIEFFRQVDIHTGSALEASTYAFRS